VIRYVVGVLGILTVRPRSRTVDVGDSVKLQCNSDQQVPPHWFVKRDSENQQKQLANICVLTGRRTDKFTLQKDASYCNLTIHDMQPRDSGVYKCTEPLNTDESAVATITVRGNNTVPVVGLH